MIDQLAVARTRQADDNATVKPVDLLQTVIADLQDGNAAADGVIVVLVSRPEDGDWLTESYRSGMTRTDEIAYLELAKDSRLREWRE